jgi:hydrogenase nickel incorporation protein HypA/HybF
LEDVDTAMHELSITRNVVAICAEQAAGGRVRRVTLEIGRLTAVLPAAVRFCFEFCAEGTALEGALLEIIETPGGGRCRACGGAVALVERYGRCSCGSNNIELTAGEALKIREMDVV